MDKRLLPYGFVWGVSLVAVYAVVLTFLFSHISTIIPTWGFVLSALLAAVYTHHERPELPKEEDFQAEGAKVVHWHILFWLFLVVFTMPSLYDFLYDLLSVPSSDWVLATQAGVAGFTGFAVSLGWSVVRMPGYLNLRERVMGKAEFIEMACMLIPLLLSGICTLFIDDRRSLFFGLLLIFFPIIIFCRFYKYYRGGKALVSDSQLARQLSTIPLNYKDYRKWETVVRGALSPRVFFAYRLLLMLLLFSIFAMIFLAFVAIFILLFS